MRQIWKPIVGALLLIGLLVNPVQAFRIDKFYQRKAVDVNKNWNREKEVSMCWAACAANLLAWSFDWSQELADEVYKEFVEDLPNIPGSPITALNHYFSKYTSPEQKKEKLDLSIFYTLFDQYTETTKFGLKEFILGSLLKGEIVAVGIRKLTEKTGHLITIYGLDYVNENSYILYYADSDDDLLMVFSDKVEIALDQHIFVTGSFKGWFIEGAVSMARNKFIKLKEVNDGGKY